MTTDFTLSPFHRLLNFTIVHLDIDRAELRLPPQETLCRLDGSDWIHGGVIASMIDIAANVSVSTIVKRTVATVDLRVDYLRPSRGALCVRAKALRVGRTLAVADVEVEDSAKLITAVGRALFSIPESIKHE